MTMMMTTMKTRRWSELNAYLALVICIAVSTIHQVSGQARLVGGQTNRVGRVEVYHDGEWGTICDDGFGPDEAGVICRMIGYPGPALNIADSFLPKATGQIWLDSVSCTGNELTIEDCQSNGWGNADCTHDEDAAVVCVSTETTTTTPATTTTAQRFTTTTGPPRICNNPSPDVRLVGGSNEAEGNVEISVNGVFGSICDDNWGVEDARVVCGMLCYNPNNAQAIKDASNMFGVANSTFVLTDVNCVGNEQHIQSCSNPGFFVGTQLCGSTEVASVRCYEETQTVVNTPTPSVECDDDNIIVRFDRLKEPTLETTHISLLINPIPGNCQYTERTEPSYVVAVIPFVNCGTNRQLNSTHIYYANTLLHNQPSTSAVITRETEYYIEVTCVIGRNTNPSDPNFAPEANVAPPVSGEGEFDVEMSLFVRNSFVQPIQNYPQPVTLGDYVYVGLTLKSDDKALKLVVPQCHATPGPTANAPPEFYLIQNKCRVEPSVTLYPMNQTVMGFRFQSFKFLQNEPLVYIHCRAYICTQTEVSSECDRSCFSSNGIVDVRRRRRGVDDNKVDSFRGVINLDRGPLVMVDDVRFLNEDNVPMEELNAVTDNETSGSSRPTVLPALVNCFLLLLSFLVLN